MWVYFFSLWLAARPYLTQKSNTLSESVNYEMGEWSRSALMNSWCYTITNGVRGISHREEFFTTLQCLCRTRHWLLRKRQSGAGRGLSLLPLIFLLPWQSFASRRKRQNYGNEEIESNRFNKPKKKERKKTLNVQHTFRGRFRCRNRNDWGCQTWSEQQCDRRIA